MKRNMNKMCNIAVLFSVAAVMAGAFFSALWMNDALTAATSMMTTTTTTIITATSPPPQTLIPITCPTSNITRIQCPSSPPASPVPLPPSPSCPSYFRWIHEDLRPWRYTGITRDMVEQTANYLTSHFRITILNGNLYFFRYQKCFQTRDTFTVWGILQLLRRYPGQIPDLDLMFNCDDLPLIKASDYSKNGIAPPPLFRYCSTDSTLDIVFPDWSFWGLR
ncbi:hypothetical protein J5N97_024125 [Dioscorea zingiberensis]|uniref:Glycosyl transferase CAP10 domain-containing protein n=1 Tax=Dioscorea zingiberensis TaxID=325984 RepID=A0A9D5C6G4_9LILI|nr:hypothetical protein J5N97_024125 [Dioscorea zingiberensis]